MTIVVVREAPEGTSVVVFSAGALAAGAAGAGDVLAADAGGSEGDAAAGAAGVAAEAAVDGGAGAGVFSSAVAGAAAASRAPRTRTERAGRKLMGSPLERVAMSPGTLAARRKSVKRPRPGSLDFPV